VSKARIPARLRELIRAQSQYRCGYCRSAETVTGVSLEIEHLIPEAAGGSSDEKNLWLACVTCNKIKSDQTHARDPITDRRLRLFNPRTQIPMFFKYTARFVLFLSFFPCAQTSAIRLPQTGFLSRTVTVNGTTYRYQVYVPADFTPKKKWPVILFLHGAGERGDDGSVHTQVGIGAAIRQHPERFPCVVVMPQCRRNQVWFGEMEQQALQALAQTMKEFNGDPQRVYLTGLSMGGYGTYYLAARHPGKFAAIAPICGGAVPPPTFPFPPDAATQVPAKQPYATIAKRLGKIPVWIFHGDADHVIPVTESRQMAEALRKLGAAVKYTEYPDVNHNSWDRAYAEPEFIPWLLSHRLGK